METRTVVAYFWHCPTIYEYMEGLRNTTKGLRQINRHPGRGSKPGHRTYDAGILATTPQRWVLLLSSLSTTLSG